MSKKRLGVGLCVMFILMVIIIIHNKVSPDENFPINQPAVTQSEQKPTSTTLVQKENPPPLKATCLENSTYLAVRTQVDQAPFPSITVYKKRFLPRDFSCRLYNVPFVVSFDLEATFPLKILGDYLISDAGTGPSVRNIIVENLITGKTSFEVRYYSTRDITFSEPHSITYWKVSNVTATAENCPQYMEIYSEGFTPILITENTTDLSTNDSTGGQSDCVATQ